MADPNPIKSALQLVLAMEEDEPVEDLLGLDRTAAQVRERAAGLTNAGRGRPPGSRNRTTEHWRQYLTKRYGSPLEILAQMAVAPIDELARELHCSRLDAAREKRHAAEALAPYLHPRLQSLEVYPAGDPRGGFLNATPLVLVEQEPIDVAAETVETVATAAGDLEGAERVEDALDRLLERARSDPGIARRIRAALE
ncbi:MAG TPA: hypothetical protein VGF39_17820 [Stellaceae bacterium]|jgi:hypothetical protein